jgi:putative Mn2+ efflux pump MntP
MNKAQKIFLMFVMAALIMLVGYVDAMFVNQAVLTVYKFFASFLLLIGCCMALHLIFLTPVEERS